MQIEKIIKEHKNKIITEVLQKSPADKKPTGTRMILKNDSIILQKL